MVEAAIFFAIAFLIIRTKTWNRGPVLKDTFRLSTVIESMFDSGPLRCHKDQDERDTEDPNSNPEYIWYEQSK